MESKEKICIVSPSLKIGGIERALSVLAGYFVSQGYPVTFISCLAGEKFYELDPCIKFIEPGFRRTGSKVNKFTYYPRMTWWLRKQVKKVDPDVVLSFGDWFNPLVLLALTGTRYPVFISDRTSPDYPFHPIVNRMKGIFYPKSAGFIAQTSRAAEYKRNIFGDKLIIKIIPNAIKQVQLFDVPRQNQIVYVGRLSIEKGPDRLIDAFAKISDTKGWKLVIAGSGPMEKELKARVAEHNTTRNIEFLGQIKGVDRLLAESGIFVLPSRLEGFPNALCEAMAAGLPAVCFDCIPSGDVITNGEDGFIVPDGDTDALAATLERLISDERLRLEVAQKALKIRERLSLEKIGATYLDFLLNVKKK